MQFCFSSSKTSTKKKKLLIANISNYIRFPPQIAYKLIEAERSKDILQTQGLSIDEWRGKFLKKL